MKFGAMDYVLAKPWTEVFDEAARLGFDGVELMMRMDTFYASEVWSPNGRKALMERSRGAGVEIASVCMGGVAGLMTDPEKHEEGVKVLADLRRFCDRLDSRVILFPMAKQSDQSEAEAMRLWRDGFIAAFERSADAKALVGMESVGQIGRSAEQLLATIEAVGSPVLGVYFDVGNAAYQGMDPVEQMEKLGKHVVQIHAKEIGAEMGEGKLNFPAIFGAIKKIGFDGYLVLETEAGEDPAANAARNLAFVKEHF